MTRVLLHLGLHKTGTTSTQTFLDNNRSIIEPHAALMLHRETRAIARWGWHYHMLRDPDALQVIDEELRDALDRLNLDGRDLIISDENFLGQMPRGDGPDPYPCAVDLLTTYLSVFQVLPQPVEVIAHITTREFSDWAISIHAHLASKLTQVRLTKDRESFINHIMEHGPETTLAEIRKALPDLDLRVEKMEALLRSPMSLAQPFVDFLHLSESEKSQLTPVGHRLRGFAPHIVDELIEMNRSDIDDDTLESAKRSFLKKIRIGAQ